MVNQVTVIMPSDRKWNVGKDRDHSQQKATWLGCSHIRVPGDLITSVAWSGYWRSKVRALMKAATSVPTSPPYAIRVISGEATAYPNKRRLSREPIQAEHFDRGIETRDTGSHMVSEPYSCRALPTGS